MQRHAGDVVDLVAHERLEVDDLLGAMPQSSRKRSASYTSSLRML